jgi:phenylacetate-coenzyme A ligase PaaK-like adenylate-forming protein
MRRAQERRLRVIVEHAYAHSPYYRRAFDAAGVAPAEIQTIDDLPRLPIFRRGAGLSHAGDIAVPDAAAFRPRRVATSGTSGDRLEFLRDRATLSIGYAALWRIWGWHGISFGHRIAEFRAFRDSAGNLDLTAVAHHPPGSRRLDLNQINTDPTFRGQAVKLLAQFRPGIVKAASPVYLVSLATYLLEHPEIRVRPHLVVTGCERLFPEQREIIGRGFGAPVIDFYGNEEFAMFAGDCEHGRMHLAAEMGVVEILRDGRPAKAGEEGEVVVTSLWNRSFPFVRYAIGDVASMHSDPCACGRGLPTWRLIGGRERDMLATPQGYLYLPNSVVGSPRWRDKIVAIRFYQEVRTDVVAQVVKGPGFVDADVDVLQRELEEYMRKQLHISIEFVDSIEKTAGGKYRLVVSKVRIDT